MSSHLKQEWANRLLRELLFILALCSAAALSLAGLYFLHPENIDIRIVALAVALWLLVLNLRRARKFRIEFDELWNSFSEKLTQGTRGIESECEKKIA